ncbi:MULTISPECIES: EAL domain-containing response regulator [Aliivibrio]|uniref:EAL domain-containing protein n=1 Tax=Aliivibrio finisterrensis TaxID=511998 RepID=A0A4Q5KZK7_9GAMM|nr:MULTISPECIES: EAL domain-containing protein [Aliivibrio]MDD9177260.1 EAL domain-containing protein [Aliivibrio sp. A6]RYU54748.1 EAL domain-containing protein [Aliivibrio finisterrensis]RYU56422.1 EAL domain-containing protein [Aliivibrio finisterrensis]RYU61543.1 EAL domain-containing protein [Aliivibrio finisterrensis]RYU66868.1 EAL domain-containing protein [Aliivibrio finisterrensis]
MNKTILIVDDVELSREILKNSISNIDNMIDVHTAINAYNAMDKITIQSYDLIIMDVMMPDGDGFELLRMISDQKISSKIIIISSLDKSIISSISLLGKLYSLNIVASLEKPIIVEQMKKLVETALYENESDASLENNQLTTLGSDDYPITLMYQSQVISDLNHIVAFEVLSRWADIDGSLLPPSFFLPMIEKLNKQKIFTEIVIKNFIEDYHQYFYDTDKSIRFAINVDPNLLTNEDIVERLIDIYASGVEHKVVIEITEKNLHMASKTELLANTLRLRLRGFEISIDDFGIGASDLERIASMPINEIKIDKNLTWSFKDNVDVLGLIENAKQLAALKNARIIFEGVENKDLKESLENINGYLHQGFLYSVPVLPCIALELLKQQKTLNSVEMAEKVESEKLYH